MRAINHALGGAVIGLSIADPVVALPLSFLSHFIVDAIPHFGVSGFDDVGGKWFNRTLLADASLCVTLVGVLAVTRPHYWVSASICAFLATSPDLMWIPNYIRVKRGKHIKPNELWLLRFHARIQWFERPIGAAVEVVWFAAGIILVEMFLV